MAAPSGARTGRWSRTLLGLTVLAPLLVFVAVTGIKLGVWDWRFGYGVLTMRVGAALAALGVFAALAGLVVAVGSRKAWPLALAGLVFGGATAAIYATHLSRIGTDILSGVLPLAAAEATTNRVDPPAFVGVMAQRRAGVPIGSPPLFQSCDAATIPTQVAPGVAAYALEQTGFDVPGFGVGRADGSRSGLWFGFAYDATIRIRPGATDIRVASREARPDGGEACTLVTRIAAELQPGA